MKSFDLAIVGGGILGTSLSYFLSAAYPSSRIVVIEQALRVAFHTSGRNTGKIHAPYLYNPKKKKIFAKAAFYGYKMWEDYSKRKSLPFKRDGVIEVAVRDKDLSALEKYLQWGVSNGLEEKKEIEIVSGTELQRIEPEVRCKAALVVRREGAVDYAEFTRSLMEDSRTSGTTFLLGVRAKEFKRTGSGWRIEIESRPGVDATVHHRDSGVVIAATNQGSIESKFLINAAGGESMDIAHDIGVAEEFTDVHFRGEYWKAPREYFHLTSTSIYSVPKFPDYPFLDPHWIVRWDGSCEVGPNAVPVFSPYGYDHVENVKGFLPKTIELLGTGALKTIFDKQFQDLVLNEVHSSLSKSAMMQRVQKFLPRINTDKFIERGTAGIRSSVIDADGKFVSDVVLVDDGESSLHILNYNSPGATGALPFSVYVVDRLRRDGFLGPAVENARCGPWRLDYVVQQLRD